MVRGLLLRYSRARVSRLLHDTYAGQVSKVNRRRVIIRYTGTTRQHAVARRDQYNMVTLRRAEFRSVSFLYTCRVDAVNTISSPATWNRLIITRCQIATVGTGGGGLIENIPVELKFLSAYLVFQMKAISIPSQLKTLVHKTIFFGKTTLKSVKQLTKNLVEAGIIFE